MDAILNEILIMKLLVYSLTLLLTLTVCPAASAAPVQGIDSMAQRLAACIACHGPQGRATPAGYLPRIAGKPEGYLYNQLINFRDGRRINPAMRDMVAHLPEPYLKEIAQYFSAQHPPYPAPQATASTAAQLEQGRQLVVNGDPARKLPACVACHAQRLTGVQPAIPGLLGLPRDYLMQQLSAWRQGSRKAAAPDCMAQVAGKLTAAELVAVAAWLSAQTVPVNDSPDTALPAPLPVACGGVQ
jgi:cytochrome c553